MSFFCQDSAELVSDQRLASSREFRSMRFSSSACAIASGQTAGLEPVIGVIGLRGSSVGACRCMRPSGARYGCSVVAGDAPKKLRPVGDTPLGGGYLASRALEGVSGGCLIASRCGRGGHIASQSSIEGARDREFCGCGLVCGDGGGSEG